MIKRLVVSAMTLVLAVGGMVAFGSQNATAQPCTDVEVVFARGTVEAAPPLGLTGISFAEALRAKLPGKSVHVHPVNYPAGANFNDRMAFVEDVAGGIRDAQNRVQHIATNCPDTDIVLGGYSQGAVVAGYSVYSEFVLPEEYREYESMVPPPLPDDVASHVASVVLFAPPSDRFLNDVGAVPIRVGPEYENKTVEYCIDGDTICDGSPVGQPNALHVLYSVNGMTLEAADHAIERM